MFNQYRLFGAFRLCLALMVVAQHGLLALGPPALRDFLAPIEIGSVAVLLFFVLSGFIVVEAAVLFYERRAAAFLLNRMIRIYPPYIVAVVLTVLATAMTGAMGGDGAVISLFGAWPDHTAHNIVASLFGIVPVIGKLLEPAESEPILILAWALRVELVFYGIVYLALEAGRALDQPVARMLGVAGVSLLAYDVLRFEALRGGGLEYTPYFVLGVSAYFAITPASLRRRALATLLVVASSIMVAYHIGGQELINEKVGYVRDLMGQQALFFAGLAVWLALLAVPRFSSALHARVRATDQAIGELTYPLYLTHMAALVPCVWLLPADSSLSLFLGVASCLGIAVLMHQVVEQRLIALRRRVRGQGVSPARDVAVV